MKYQKLDLIQGSAEWKVARLKHLTASQAPVLFNLSPYQTPCQLFEEKMTGREMTIDDFKLKLFMKGHDAEAAARSWLIQHLGIQFAPSVLESVPHPDLLASLDAHSEADNLIGEIKYMGRQKFEDVKNGVLQSHHLCQIQAQLLVSGAEKCIYFATTESGESAMAEVMPDPGYFEQIVTASEKFMRDVREGKAPELSDRDFYLPDEDPRFDELARAKAEMDLAQGKFEELKAEVLKKYGHHKRVKYQDITIVRSIRKGNINYSKIEALKSFNFEPYRGKPTEVVTVRFGKTDGEA